MAIVLRKPGTIYEENMEELGLKLFCKALDAQLGCEVQKRAARFVQFLRTERKKDSESEDASFDLVDYLATVIGYCVEDIEGLEYEGKPYKLEKTQSGKLSMECLSVLMPVALQVADFLIGRFSLTKEDIKNS